MQLPYSEELEIQYLSRLFDKTSECYKFFWFQAIVTKLLEGKMEITYNELINEMVADAWYMVTEYHLNLGPKDNLEASFMHFLKRKDWDVPSKKLIKKINLILYLQKRNPSVPGIADKLYPPQECKLDKVKKYWKLILTLHPVQEIYSGVELDGKDISIDHFVPWSYMAHDSIH